MKKKLLTIGAFLSFTALGFSISRVIYAPNTTQHTSTSEYQLEMEDDYLTIRDGGRHVAKVYYKDAGIVATELIADNE